MYFDSHVHTDGLGFSELRLMAENGIRFVCSPTYFPVRPRFAETMVDVIRKMVDFEAPRCRSAGIEATIAVGVHPRCIPQNYGKVLDFLEEHEWSAFGEIGLETGGKEEVEVLKKQLEIAKRKDIPCVIHTPRANKRVITEKTLEVLSKVDFPPERAVIDHVNFENLDLVLKEDYMIGLTIQPGKLSAEDAAKIVEEHGAERFMLNSDAGYVDSDFLSVARAAKVVGDERVYFKNARKFFS
ncbi:MAG: TatD family hydrolase [Archaeoglobaceae archaeon]